MNTPVLGVENDSISLHVTVNEVNPNLSTIPADSSCGEAMIEDPIITSKKRRVSAVSVSIGRVKKVVLEKDSEAENTPQCVPHVSTCIGKKDREVGPGVEENTSQSL